MGTKNDNRIKEPVVAYNVRLMLPKKEMNRLEKKIEKEGFLSPIEMKKYIKAKYPRAYKLFYEGKI